MDCIAARYSHSAFLSDSTVHGLCPPAQALLCLPCISYRGARLNRTWSAEGHAECHFGAAAESQGNAGALQLMHALIKAGPFAGQSQG